MPLAAKGWGVKRSDLKSHMCVTGHLHFEVSWKPTWKHTPHRRYIHMRTQKWNRPYTCITHLAEFTVKFLRVCICYIGLRTVCVPLRDHNCFLYNVWHPNLVFQQNATIGYYEEKMLRGVLHCSRVLLCPVIV